MPPFPELQVCVSAAPCVWLAHNTNIALQWQTKTLITVHKTFLMAQWRVRIHQFIALQLGIGIMHHSSELACKLSFEDGGSVHVLQFAVCSLQFG